MPPDPIGGLFCARNVLGFLDQADPPVVVDGAHTQVMANSSISREQPIAGGPQGEQHPEATLSRDCPAWRVTHQQDGKTTGKAQQIAVIDRAPRGDIQQASKSEQVPPVTGKSIILVEPWFWQLEVKSSEPHRANRSRKKQGERLNAEGQFENRGGEKSLKTQRERAVRSDSTIGTGEIWPRHQSNDDRQDSHPSHEPWLL